MIDKRTEFDHSVSEDGLCNWSDEISQEECGQKGSHQQTGSEFYRRIHLFNLLNFYLAHHDPLAEGTNKPVCIAKNKCSLILSPSDIKSIQSLSQEIKDQFPFHFTIPRLEWLISRINLLLQTVGPDYSLLFSLGVLNFYAKQFDPARRFLEGARELHAQTSLNNQIKHREVIEDLIGIINYKSQPFNYKANTPKIIYIKCIRAFGSAEKRWQFELEKIMQIDSCENGHMTQVNTLTTWSFSNLSELIDTINQYYSECNTICLFGHTVSRDRDNITHVAMDFKDRDSKIILPNFIELLHQIKNIQTKSLLWFSCNTKSLIPNLRFQYSIVYSGNMDFRTIFPFAFAFFRILISTDDIPKAFNQAKIFAAILSPWAKNIFLGEST